MQPGPEAKRRHRHHGAGHGAPLLIQPGEVGRYPGVGLGIRRTLEPPERRLVRAARIPGDRRPHQVRGRPYRVEQDRVSCRRRRCDAGLSPVALCPPRCHSGLNRPEARFIWLLRFSGMDEPRACRRWFAAASVLFPLEDAVRIASLPFMFDALKFRRQFPCTGLSYQPHVTIYEANSEKSPLKTFLFGLLFPFLTSDKRTDYIR